MSSCHYLFKTLFHPQVINRQDEHFLVDICMSHILHNEEKYTISNQVVFIFFIIQASKSRS